MTHQRLADRSLVRNNMTLGVTVPCAQNRVGFLFSRIRSAQRDDGADGNARRIRIFKRCATRTVQRLLEFGLAPHEHGLHLFRRFEFKIFAEIAIRPCQRDLLAVLRDFLFHQLFVFRSPLCQTAPGDNESRCLFFSLSAGDHHREFGIKFNDPGQKRPFRQFVERRGDEESPHRIARNTDIGASKHVPN